MLFLLFFFTVIHLSFNFSYYYLNKYFEPLMAVKQKKKKNKYIFELWTLDFELFRDRQTDIQTDRRTDLTNLVPLLFVEVKKGRRSVVV